MYPKGTTTRKRGDAKGTPPQTLVFVFLVKSFYVVPIFHVHMLMTYWTLLAHTGSSGIWVTRPIRKGSAHS